VSELVSKGVRLGRTLSIMDLTFDGVPDDGGLWWLCWMDYGAVTTTSRSSYRRPRLGPGCRW